MQLTARHTGLRKVLILVNLQHGLDQGVGRHFKLAALGTRRGGVGLWQPCAPASGAWTVLKDLSAPRSRAFGEPDKKVGCVSFKKTLPLGLGALLA